jgi:hypothetical protein
MGRYHMPIAPAVTPGEQLREIGVIREYSDLLLMFMLKARRPDKFRNSYVPPQDDGADNAIPIKGGLPAEQPVAITAPVRTVEPGQLVSG